MPLKSTWASAARLGFCPERLGQAPIEHEHLAEGAQHHVGRLQVAMDDALGVGVADGVTDADKGGQQAAQFQRIRSALLPQAVVLFDGRVQRSAPR